MEMSGLERRKFVSELEYTAAQTNDPKIIKDVTALLASEFKSEITGKKDEDVLRAIISTLGRLGDENSFEPLAQALEDKALARSAADAFATLADRGIVSNGVFAVLVVSLALDKHPTDAHGAMEDAAKKVMMALMKKNKDPDVQYGIVELFKGRLKVSAESILYKMLESKEYEDGHKAITTMLERMKTAKPLDNTDSNVAVSRIEAHIENKGRTTKFRNLKNTVRFKLKQLVARAQ